MKTLESRERSTGRGAKRYSAALKEGKFIRASRLPEAHYIGRETGEKIYQVDLPDDAITARFYRSNSGKETVTCSNGMEWNSFDEARRWAAENYDPGDGTMTFTGRQLRELCAFAHAVRGCAIAPEEHLEAPRYFDDKDGDIYDDDIIPVAKVILYFEAE